jgi:hypothetical protein
VEGVGRGGGAGGSLGKATVHRCAVPFETLLQTLG